MSNYRLDRQIPTFNENVKTNCYNCRKLTNLFLDHPKKGRLYLCSRSCQSNFSLKSGMRGYNTVRDHSPRRLTTVGNLNNLTAKEMQRVLEFRQGYNRHSMAKLKEGQSPESVSGMMSTRHKRSNKVSKGG